MSEPAALDRARAAKALVLARVGGHPAVNGVGVARDGDRWAVKVTLVRAAPDLDVPSDVEGVAVQVHVVGRIVAR